jgi:hypothetical protein
LFRSEQPRRIIAWVAAIVYADDRLTGPGSKGANNMLLNTQEPDGPEISTAKAKVQDIHHVV